MKSTCALFTTFVIEQILEDQMDKIDLFSMVPLEVLYHSKVAHHVGGHVELATLQRVRPNWQEEPLEFPYQKELEFYRKRIRTSSATELTKRRKEGGKPKRTIKLSSKKARGSYWGYMFEAILKERESCFCI